MIAAQIASDDIGAEVEFTIGELTVHGRLKEAGRVLGMVKVVLDNEGNATGFAVYPEKEITFTYEHARFRALTESDAVVRAVWLAEANRLAGRVEEAVEGES